jgi:putative FmdB family regulatory protein
MPNYGFVCSKCEHTFDLYLKMEERENPISEKCPNCGKKKSVRRQYDSFTQPISADATLTPNKATGGRWNALMNRMKPGLAKRFHKNLDAASSRTGRHWS